MNQIGGWVLLSLDGEPIAFPRRQADRKWQRANVGTTPSAAVIPEPSLALIGEKVLDLAFHGPVEFLPGRFFEVRIRHDDFGTFNVVVNHRKGGSVDVVVGPDKEMRMLPGSRYL